jgi:non-ribosomal peptide synthetase component F
LTIESPSTAQSHSSLREEREYWKKRMGEDWPRVSLWSDTASPHAPQPTSASSHAHGQPDAPQQPPRGHLSYSFAPDLVRRLSQLTGDSPFLLFTTLMAALKVTLYRYSGQRRLCVATPALQPPAGGVEGSPQPVALNAVVIADELDPQSTFRALLMQVRQTLLDAYAHQRYPLTRLMQDLRVRSVAGEACPLFGVAARLAELHTQMPQVGEVSMLSFERKGVELSVGVSFGTESAESVREWLRHYEELLASAVGGVEQRVSELEMVGRAEREQLVEEWNRTEREYERDKGVHELIAEQAARTPEAVAVEDEREAVTYREMEARAGRLSAELVRRGVKADELVGVMMERSVGLVVGLLGVLKAGGAYVPVEESYPAKRVRQMLGGVRVVVTQEGWRERVAEVVNGGEEGEGGAGIEVVVVERAIAREGDEELERETKVERGGERERSGEGEREGEREAGRASGENLAYVIYTSGSTGRPKGVMISHRAICNRLLWMQDEYRLSENDRVLQKTPYTFDVSVWEFFWPLMTGARLVMARPGGHQDSAYLARLIAERQITTLHFVPSMLQVFLDEEGLEASCRTIGRPDSEHASLHSGCTHAARARRCQGRTLLGRRRARQRLSAQTRPDGGAIHPAPVLDERRRARVPDGRRGAVSCGRRDRVSGTGRPSGEGARLPDRVGRNRSGVAATGAGQRCGRRGERRKRAGKRLAAYIVLDSQNGSARAERRAGSQVIAGARGCAQRVAGLYGAGMGHRSPRVAPDA